MFCIDRSVRTGWLRSLVIGLCIIVWVCSVKFVLPFSVYTLNCADYTPPGNVTKNLFSSDQESCRPIRVQIMTVH